MLHSIETSFYTSIAWFNRQYHIVHIPSECNMTFLSPVVYYHLYNKYLVAC